MAKAGIYADLLPPLSTEEFDALKADIKANGVRVPVDIDEDGVVLDGHHRLKIEPKAPRRVIKGLSETEKEAFVYRSNFARRNLSSSQRDELLKKMKATAARLRADGRTQAQTGKLLGVLQQRIADWESTDIHDTGTGNRYIPDVRVKVAPTDHPVIADRVTSGESQAQVAADYGITQAQVSRIGTKEKKQKAEKVGRKKTDDKSCTVEDLQLLIDQHRTFGTIYADPPWPYANQATRASTGRHYETMSLKELAEMPIAALADERSHLHLWTTNAFLFDAKEIIEAWGFEYKSCYVWVKSQMGIGNYWRVSHEFLLLGVRGGLTFDEHGQKSWGEFRRSKHSQKPDKIRHIVELVSPSPRLELFTRKATPGWVCWGNEISRDLFSAEMASA